MINPRRFSNALAIQNGAVNPSGICQSILEACAEIRPEPHTGTKQICEDPAVRLMCHQLAFLCGIITGAEEFARAPDYSTCTAECERRSKVAS